MSTTSMPTADAVTVTAQDLRRSLRISRSAAYDLMHRAGAVRVARMRTLRLPVGRLLAILGEELTLLVLRSATSSPEVR
jgi:hypothetical protein